MKTLKLLATKLGFIGFISAREKLVYRGVAIPEEFRRQAARESAEAASVVKKSLRIYLGQITPCTTEEPVRPTPRAESIAAIAEFRKRTKRIYRGQVIAD